MRSSIFLYIFDITGHHEHADHPSTAQMFDAVLEAGKYSKRRRSNVAVIIVRVVFIGLFLFYCLLLNHSFQTNPNKITNCCLFSLCYNWQLHCSCVAILIFEQANPLHNLTTTSNVKHLNNVSQDNNEETSFNQEHSFFDLDPNSNTASSSLSSSSLSSSPKVSIQAKRASIAYMESAVVDISIHPPSFKPVSLSLPRSPLSKTPKQVFF